jgi:hypothetical protein
MPDWMRRVLRALGLVGDFHFAWFTLGLGTVLAAGLTGVLALAETFPWWIYPPLFFGIALLLAGLLRIVVDRVRTLRGSGPASTDEIAILRQRVAEEDWRINVAQLQDFIGIGQARVEEFRAEPPYQYDEAKLLPGWRGDMDGWERQIVRDVLADSQADIDEFMAPITEDMYGSSNARMRLATRYEIRSRRLQDITGRRRLNRIR